MTEIVISLAVAFGFIAGGLVAVTLLSVCVLIRKASHREPVCRSVSPVPASMYERGDDVAGRLELEGFRSYRSIFADYTGHSPRDPHGLWTTHRNAYAATGHTEDYNAMLRMVTLDNPPLADDMRIKAESVQNRDSVRNYVLTILPILAGEVTALTVGGWKSFLALNLFLIAVLTISGRG